MKKNISKLSFLLLLIVLNCKYQAFGQLTVDEIIAKHLQTTGLEKIGSELKMFKIEGEMLQGKLRSPLIINGIIPDKLRMDMVYKDQNYIKISNGDKSWDYNPTNDSIISYSNKKVEAQNFIERLTGELYNYKSDSMQVNLVGLVSIDDVELYKLELIDNKSIRIYYIDKLSFLIRRIDDDVVENRITYYTNYRKVGKYFLPFSLIGFEGGVSSISMQFKSIIINPDIKSELFDKPLLKR